jgi:hypothetical protein
MNSKILSIDTDDDDNNYQEFSEFIEENIISNKNKIADRLNEIGEDLLAEIEEKQRQKNLQKEILIKFIVKQKKNKYSSQLLMTYSFEDVKNIYDEIKNKPNRLIEIFKFIFNL